MRRRTRPVNGERWRGEYFWPPFVTYLVVLAVVFGGTVAIYAIWKGDRNDTAKDNRNLERMFYSYQAQASDNSPRMQAMRRETARRILWVQNDYEKLAHKKAIDIDKGLLKQYQRIAQTGQPLKLDVRTRTFNPYWGLFYIWWVQLLLVCGGGVFFLARYLASLFDNLESHHLADLPWRKPWPWIITILLGPVGWLAMGISRVLLRFEPPVVQEVAPPPPEVETIDEEVEEADEEPRPAPRKTYRNFPQAALSLYLEMRMKSAEEYRRQRHQELLQLVARTRENIREYGDEIKDEQRQLNEYRAEAQAVEQSLEDGISAEDPDKIREEFDRFLSLPGVIAVQVVNDRIRVIVRATVEYQGRTYDKGDWQIDIGADTSSCVARELRTGVRPDWGYDYPDYRYGDKSYCFGSRAYELEQHLRKGQFLEAMALAVECLNSVNSEDAPNIPHAFWEVQPLETVDL